MADTVLLIRHAEKPDASRGERGSDAFRRDDADALSAQGWQRARLLAAWIAGGAARRVHARLHAPDALVAAADPGRSRRPHDTLVPLSYRLAMPVIDLPGAAAAPGTAGILRTLPGTVMVCWRHRELPGLLRALLPGVDGLPEAWPADRFDLVWIVADGRLAVVEQDLSAVDPTPPGPRSPLRPRSFTDVSGGP